MLQTPWSHDEGMARRLGFEDLLQKIRDHVAAA